MAKIRITVEVIDPELIKNDVKQSQSFEGDGMFFFANGVNGSPDACTQGVLGDIAPDDVVKFVKHLPMAERVTGMTLMMLMDALIGSMSEDDGDGKGPGCCECDDIECASHPANVAPEKAKIVSIDGKPLDL